VTAYKHKKAAYCPPPSPKAAILCMYMSNSKKID